MERYLQYLSGAAPEACGVYEKSVRKAGNTAVYMADAGACDVLVVSGDTAGFSGVPAQAGDKACLVCPLCHENAVMLRKLFPYTAPVKVLGDDFSFGVGDRLGIATPGHIRVFERFGGKPVFAQQSIRELNLTGRDYDHVLDCASFAVFQAGYEGGFGADGDHLKTDDEVKYALRCGYTMITLDCSEHIRNDVTDLSDEDVRKAYDAARDPELELFYLGKTYHLGEISLHFDEMSFKRMVLIYGEAIRFAIRIYETYLAGENAQADFEVSIDETATPTTPLQHFFFANELHRRHIAVKTMAPRFCGEFQKGVDYIGDLARFEEEFAVHAAIAKSFGYKISVHSGSDKFSVFPIVGQYTGGRVHVKTAGTNWLEAMRVVALTDPALYRAVHKFALTQFAEAKKFYHVTTDLNKIPDVDTLKDSELPALFEQNDARQLIHITYGFILNATDETGAPLFKNALFALWRREREAYAGRLEHHIGRHIEKLRERL